MRRIRFPVATLVGLLGAGSLSSPGLEAAVRRVPQDYPHITDALLLSGPGDVVLVAPGTYAPSLTGEVYPLQVSAGVTLAGAGQDVSILDAQGTGSVVHLTGAAARVTGFTLTGGAHTEGGGVRVFPVGSSEIDHNLIRGNRSQVVGSGIFVAPGGITWIHHNVVWENTDLDPVGPGDPHGVEFSNSWGTVERNVIGRGDSNGLITNASAVIIRDNIFFENGTPGVRGRGICAVGGSQPVIAHNLFFGNQLAAILVAPGVGNVTGDQANQLSATDGVYGNLDADPLFEDAEGGDWHLCAASPAIDAGDPASGLDPDGTRADAGVFYFPHAPTGLPGDEASGLALLASPNPTTGPTTFQYSTAHAERVELTIYDVHGRRTALLVAQDEAAGPHKVRWDGTSQATGRVAPGVYFARLRVGSAEGLRKLLIVR